MRKGYAPVGHLYSHFDQISVKISVLELLYPYYCTDGVKFGVEEGTLVPSSMPNLTPIGAACHPCGAKNIKIGL